MAPTRARQARIGVTVVAGRGPLAYPRLATVAVRFLKIPDNAPRVGRIADLAPARSRPERNCANSVESSVRSAELDPTGRLATAHPPVSDVTAIAVLKHDVGAAVAGKIPSGDDMIGADRATEVFETERNAVLH